ncbi:hypothetical protein COV18_06485 [Candidatus Woesearchaeota archaeon CG10_big_fil_rev_8_21_14_0_10_37_12]|nr:MAG: hypothetical protein COV18_06485 [Candidatus Woesearchaeota archaeon CG10_big_fil_rev_8_21_14_0_10_37_12]
MGNELTGWENDLATLIVGADSLLGGDFRSPSGGDHFVAEPWTVHWTSDDIEAVYDDVFAQELRRKGGAAGFNDSAAVGDFVARYGLPLKQRDINKATVDLPPLRRKFIENLTNGLNLIVHTGLAQAGIEGAHMPEFDARYRAATRHEGPIRLVDVSSSRDRLRRLLHERGYDQTYLVDAVHAWETDQERLKPEDIPGKIEEISRKLTPVVKERLLDPLIFHILMVRGEN